MADSQKPQSTKYDDSPFLTTGERVKSFLLWGFVLSILAHVLLGPLIPFKSTQAKDQEVEKVSVTKKIKVKVPTPPPPTPTPRPTQQPKTTPPPKKVETHPQPQLKIQPPKTSTNSGAGPAQQKYVPPKNGSQNGVPAGQGTAPPGPVATPGPPASTPKPSCATPFKEATMVNGVTPEYPEAAKEANLGPVTVIVKITLSASASVLGASVLQSSGNSQIDNAALSAARQSSYSAKVENCTPVEGSYSFRANFDPSS